MSPDNSQSASTFVSLILEHHKPPALPVDPSALSYIHEALFNIDALDTLLQKGADPNSGEHCTNPPLMDIMQRDIRNYGVSTPFRAICRLLEHEADVRQMNEEGKCFVDVVKEASRARAENTDELAEFKYACCEISDYNDAAYAEDNFFALQCRLLLVCGLVVDAVSGEENVKYSTLREQVAAGRLKDYERRRAVWEQLHQHEKGLQVKKTGQDAERK